MTDIQQTIAERIDTMPPQLKRAVDHVDIDAQFRTLTQKFGFHADTMNRLYILVWTILLGMDDTEEFGKRIQEDLNLGNNIARDVAKSVEELIFQPIRDYMKEHTDTEKEGEEIGTRPVTPKNVKLNVEKEEKVQQPNPAPESSPSPQEPGQKTALEPQQVSPESQQEEIGQKSPQPQKGEVQQPQQTPSRMEESMRTTRKEEGGGGDKDEYGAHDPYREPLD
ncbi:MAG: hypothetical protein WDZ70_00285, partial [Candidatus Paceibacterota bacterium]